jgi:dATP pyrophosphohydrolase
MKSKLVEAHIFRRVNNELEFLLLKRSEEEIYPDLWQMVTGSVKPGEKAYETAVREIKEETNLTPLKLWVVPNINSFYMPKDDAINLVPVFVAQVTDEQEVKISSEHVEYKWTDRDEACTILAWEGQRKSVEIIHSFFTKIDPNYKFEQIRL